MAVVHVRALGCLRPSESCGECHGYLNTRGQTLKNSSSVADAPELGGFGGKSALLKFLIAQEVSAWV